MRSPMQTTLTVAARLYLQSYYYLKTSALSYPDIKLETLRPLLDEYHAVLADRGNKDYGILTKHDLLIAMK